MMKTDDSSKHPAKTVINNKTIRIPYLPEDLFTIDLVPEIFPDEVCETGILAFPRCPKQHIFLLKMRYRLANVMKGGNVGGSISCSIL